jgi:hypothetical protein
MIRTLKRGNGQRPSGMEEDFIGNEGLHRTVALEEEEEEEEEETMKKKRRNRFWENVQLSLR